MSDPIRLSGPALQSQGESSRPLNDRNTLLQVEEGPPLDVTHLEEGAMAGIRGTELQGSGIIANHSRGKGNKGRGSQAL